MSQEASDTFATRVDSAHVSADVTLAEPDSEAPAIELLQAVAGRLDHPLSEQMQRQASELANHMRSQRRRLDRRESELNAHVAQLEGELRTNRLILREREQEIELRDKQLAEQISQVEQKAQTLADAELACERDLKEREGQLQRIQHDTIRRWRAALDGTTLQQRVEVPGPAEIRSEEDALAREVQVAANRLRQREQLVDESEAVLKDQLAQVASDRLELEQERARLGQQLHEDRERLSQLQRSAEVELTSKRQQLAQRKQELDRRRTTLEQLHGEVTRLHRESLELRLVTEQLWARLSGKLGPAAMTKALAELRSKLADHYRLADQTLSERKQELQELGVSLAEQQQAIQQQRGELQQWAARRRQEVEHEAARIVAREQQLERREADQRQVRDQHDQQLRQHEEKIRDLMKRLRSAGTLSPSN